MEKLCERFPHLAGCIFDQVDDEILNKCKEISREVLEYLEKERFFWIRIIKKYRGSLKDFPKSWKPVIDKSPVEKVKQIAIAVSQFFQCYHLYYNIRYHHEQKLRGQKLKWSLITISANHGDLALVQFVVNKIKLKNIKQTERQIALFVVAGKECKGCEKHKGHYDIYDFLTSKLRDKNPGKMSPLNKEGRTPLHYAANIGNFGLCKLIIEGTPNKNPASVNASSNTPLHHAAQKGHLKVCKLIMDNITDKNPFNSVRHAYSSETPYHFAAKSGQLAVCQLMIDNLLDKNPGTRAMMTPLHGAASNGHLEVCKLIMANITNKNPNNTYPQEETPYHLAARYGHLAVCQLFYDNLPDKNPATKDERWNKDGLEVFHTWRGAQYVNVRCYSTIVSMELNHLAAILQHYAGGLICMN